MPTKQQQADESYHRVEAMRALRGLLQIVEEKIAALEDNDDLYQYRCELEEAVLRVREFYLPAPVAPKPIPETEPGQIGLDGSIAQLAGLKGVIKGVPQTCARCGRDMIDAQGGSWTPMVHAPQAPFYLQCGNCAFMAIVTEEGWNRVVEARRYAHSHTDTVKSAVKPERESRKRTRGAG